MKPELFRYAAFSTNTISRLLLVSRRRMPADALFLSILVCAVFWQGTLVRLNQGQTQKNLYSRRSTKIEIKFGHLRVWRIEVRLNYLWARLT